MTTMKTLVTDTTRRIVWPAKRRAEVLQVVLPDEVVATDVVVVVDEVVLLDKVVAINVVVVLPDEVVATNVAVVVDVNPVANRVGSFYFYAYFLNGNLNKIKFHI